MTEPDYDDPCQAIASGDDPDGPDHWCGFTADHVGTVHQCGECGHEWEKS